MSSQISFSKKINDLTSIFFQKNQWTHKYFFAKKINDLTNIFFYLFPKKSTTSQISFYLFPKNQLPHKYIFPKKSTTSQISVSKKIKNHTNIFFQKRVKPQRYPFQERNQRPYIHVQCTMYFPKRKGLKHWFSNCQVLTAMKQGEVFSCVSTPYFVRQVTKLH